MEKNHHGSRWRSVVLKTALFSQILVLTPIILVFERFLPRKKRPLLWRRVAASVCRRVFRMAGVRVKIFGEKNIFDGAAIYAANHGSPYDGFILLSILGEKAAVFTAPLRAFPGPIAFWLQKIGGISVRRDGIDDIRHAKDPSKKQALGRVHHLLEGNSSLIIFPEGHIESMGVLHYFHTGVARMSASSQLKIIPVGIIGGPECFPDRHKVSRGVVSVRFGKAIPPVRSVEDRRNIAVYRNRIQKHISDLLPRRYLPSYYHARLPRQIGVFVDIDRTIYNGLSQIDFLRYLLSMHRITNKDVLRAFYWVYLEHAGKISHEEAMKKEYVMLKGWDVQEVDSLAKKAFDQNLKKDIEYRLYARLYDHAKAGHTVVFVSEVMHPLAKQFKNFFHADAVLDTKLNHAINHGHERYTGDVRCLCYKQTKADLVKNFADHHGIKLERSYGYADSKSDIPFLSLVKYPIAVNPDKTLKSYAGDHHWKSVQLTEG